ncbi:hypothetical protein NAEGRDRAFT_78598 [Naegleria gruberi]|uniref:Uncharacterized protein n=1 Tax=Naegleria gruberi TaxID=5762 RepID=D2V4U4_NAEGR|nr:uncharacterized protein NAEGRDRAFT_78598 [Naegleria gruberi]EFC47993.1 hypothetical protein NAEGRDRAFT_78598 [Naegleria gruberi]|eukprot:XP_002680737.1 hypothetical protein NAEGRDRAFT_78598 [Naegleria gruberi strain NEG-M]
MTSRQLSLTCSFGCYFMTTRFDEQQCLGTSLTNSDHSDNGTAVDNVSVTSSCSSSSSTSSSNNDVASSDKQQQVEPFYHKIQELCSSSLLKYNHGKYYYALQSFNECLSMVEKELSKQGLDLNHSTLETNQPQDNTKALYFSNQLLDNSSSTCLVEHINEDFFANLSDTSQNYYLYLYYQLCFQLAKCHFKLGQLSKAYFYLYNICSRCENITNDLEYSLLLHEVEQMVLFDKVIDDNKTTYSEELENYRSPKRKNSLPTSNVIQSRLNPAIPASHTINPKLYFPLTYTPEQRDDWQSTFMKYQKKVCK